MYVEWTKNCTDVNDKEAFQRQVQNSKPVLDRLKDIISDRLRAMDIGEVSLSTYDSPNWGYRQAHVNGSKAFAYALTKLIDLDQQKQESKHDQ